MHIRAQDAAPAGAAPISQDQLRALVEASRRAKKIRRCITIARFGGWTTGAFGVMTLLGLVLSPSLATAYVGCGLLLVAYGEFRGATLMHSFDLRGPRHLALNQLLLGAILVTYALWSLFAGLGDPSAALRTGDPGMDAMVADLTRMMNVAVYTSLIVVGTIAPGLTALYYASRTRHLRLFREQTDVTVIEALKAA